MQDLTPLCWSPPGVVVSESSAGWANWGLDVGRREPRLSDHGPDTSAAPPFLWDRLPPGRRQYIARRVIQLGGRHDSVVASIEETGSIWNNEAGLQDKKNPPSKRRAG